jgi:hypothetical protein
MELAVTGLAYEKKRQKTELLKNSLAWSKKNLQKDFVAAVYLFVAFSPSRGSQEFCRF